MELPQALSIHTRAVLSPGFNSARRSLRVWPVEGTCQEQIWENVGDFLHITLGIPTSDLCQDDIEEVVRACHTGTVSDLVNNKVLVKFFDKKKRDMVMSSSPMLAGCVDQNGRPTAGIRLEIPPELADTFRLLARFGTRLRARHGEGTKRHIKFDDFAGSLYANIKLPGDTTWTKVSPAAAREDLEASIREENLHNQRRMATKLVPGPRERLARQQPAIGAPAPEASLARGRNPDLRNGQRPRWSAPDRRGPHPDRA